jgi:hypothetical protein
LDAVFEPLCLHRNVPMAVPAYIPTHIPTHIPPMITSTLPANSNIVRLAG